MMLGIYGLFFELGNPGSLVPGILGGICLLLALFAFQALPVNYAGVGLILLGVILLILEVKVPSFGGLTVGGIAALVLGSLHALRLGRGPWAPLSLLVMVPSRLAFIAASSCCASGWWCAASGGRWSPGRQPWWANAGAWCRQRRGLRGPGAPPRRDLACDLRVPARRRATVQVTRRGGRGAAPRRSSRRPVRALSLSDWDRSCLSSSRGPCPVRGLIFLSPTPCGSCASTSAA